MPELPGGTVTFLLTDVEGSTRRWELEPVAMRSAIAHHDSVLAQAVAAAGGTLIKSRGEGDSAFAVFGRATDAVTAAAHAQRELAAAASGLSVRMALHTGEAELRDGDYFGTAVNRCARLRAIANGGQVLLSRPTHDVVRDELPAGLRLLDLGEHRLRDLAHPERVFQLEGPGLASAFPPLRSLGSFPTNLPVQLSSFVGRTRDIEEVTRLLDRSRLVTLSGAAGCGKTRLAIQVAAERVDDYPDGAWLVELAAVSDPALVDLAVATTLGMREDPSRPIAESLAIHLRQRRVLLLLDNCEHLIAACANLVEALLRAAPGLRILATSREALNIAGELAWRVPSLEIPEVVAVPDLEHLRSVESIRLFLDRAAFSDAAFALTRANAPAVVQICRRLDGIPLAIELAAARVRVMSVDQIVSRLEDRFRLLTGGSRTALERQQTLRACVAWSYSLLTDDEARLFGRLAVFSGGFQLEAAETVCGGDGLLGDTILDLLSRLVDKSLVVASGGRYGLLETLRQFGRDQLIERGEADALQRRHAAYYARFAEATASGWMTFSQPEVLASIYLELENLRAAMEACRAVDPETGLRIAAGIGLYWWFGGSAREGVERLDGFLSQYSERDALRARSLFYCALARIFGGDLERPRTLLDEALGIATDRDDERLRALVLVGLGVHHTTRGESDLALPILEEARSLARDDHLTLHLALFHLGVVHFVSGDFERSRSVLEETVAVTERAGDRSLESTAHGVLGSILLIAGDFDAARRRFEKALQLAVATSDWWNLAWGLEFFVMLASAEGQAERAVRLAGAAAALNEAKGRVMPAVMQPVYRSSLAVARAALPDPDAEFESGRRIGLDAAIEYALEPA